MTDAPLLLTPGPLTTTDSVKRAMLRDWGSRDPEFEALTAHVRAELLAIANAGDAYTAVPLQGSGTFAVEAMIAARRIIFFLLARRLSVCASARCVSSPLPPDNANTHWGHHPALHCGRFALSGADRRGAREHSPRIAQP